jgi:hypothetical protein
VIWLAVAACFLSGLAAVTAACALIEVRRRRALEPFYESEDRLLPQHSTLCEPVAKRAGSDLEIVEWRCSTHCKRNGWLVKNADRPIVRGALPPAKVVPLRRSREPR